jgi:hypothetical protein
MDAKTPANNNSEEPAVKPQSETETLQSLAQTPINFLIKSFFELTGGSLLYCLSAVFVAYGIVKVLGPILAESSGLKEALPCIGTLHVYELALLSVLVLIVSRKVVDDAISITILIALFLVATGIAQGSVTEKDFSASLYLGLGGIVLALGKFSVMRRFARIPFRALSVAGLGILVTYNYVGPVLMARSVSVNPTEEAVRRDFWLFLCLTMLIGAGFVIIEAMREHARERTDEKERVPLLQSPAMVYIFSLLVIAASGVHQYCMAYSFALERVLGDYIVVITICTLLTLEIIRHLGKRFGVIEIVVSCVPLAITMLAIQQKSVLASGQLGPGLMCYPPVVLALSGLAIGGLAVYHRWYPLVGVAFIYGIGVILTAGFSPENPHDLNTHACIGTLVVALLVYGMIIRNQFLCLAGIIILCFGLLQLETFSKFAADCALTKAGGIAGVFGLGSMSLLLFFGKQLHKAAKIIGILCLAGFVFDYLPESFHIRYLVVLFGTGLLIGGLWLRTKDILAILILCVPYLTRLYMVAKHIAHWRFVILGFLLLGAGTIVSLLKRPKTVNAREKDEAAGQ